MRESKCKKQACNCTRFENLVAGNKVETRWRKRVVVGSGWEVTDGTTVGEEEGTKIAKLVTLIALSERVGDLAETHLRRKGHCPRS